MYGYAFAGTALLRFGAPDIAAFTSRTAANQGRFQRMHQRLRSQAESVSMMGGHEPELNRLNGQLEVVIAEQQRQIREQAAFNSVNSFFLSYVPPLLTNALQLSWSQGAYSSADQIMGEQGGTGLSAQGSYISSLISQGFTATSSMLSIHSTFQYFIGSTRRVTDLMLVMEDIKQARAEFESELSAEQQVAPSCISLDNVDIVAPDGTCVASRLSLVCEPGSNVLVSGPNGCGKSSLFRTLADIWRAPFGSVHMPPQGVVMVSQRPLATTCAVSLLDFLTYPIRLAVSEREEAKVVLHEFMTDLGVDYLAAREESWETRQRWADKLSLGEQQCLSCVRSFFKLRRDSSPHQWLVMDESTSALESSLEEKIFRYAQAHGISLLTFSTRRSAAAYHQRLLTLGVDGRRGWELGPMRTESLMASPTERTGLDISSPSLSLIAAKPDQERSLGDDEENVPPAKGIGRPALAPTSPNSPSETSR